MCQQFQLHIICHFSVVLISRRKRHSEKPKHHHDLTDMNNRLYSKVDNRTRAQNAYSNPGFDDDRSTNQITSNDDDISKNQTSENSKNGTQNGSRRSKDPDGTEHIHSVDEITLVMNDISGLSDVTEKPGLNQSSQNVIYSKSNKNL